MAAVATASSLSLSDNGRCSSKNIISRSRHGLQDQEGGAAHTSSSSSGSGVCGMMPHSLLPQQQQRQQQEVGKPLLLWAKSAANKDEITHEEVGALPLVRCMLDCTMVTSILSQR